MAATENGFINLKSEVHTAVAMKNTILWNVMTCILVVFRRLLLAYYMFGSIFNPKMGAVFSCETSADFYQSI
jgi:hypothetical protein